MPNRPNGILWWKRMDSNQLTVQNRFTVDRDSPTSPLFQMLLRQHSYRIAMGIEPNMPAPSTILHPLSRATGFEPVFRLGYTNCFLRFWLITPYR